jgi:coniferyl-aldehyde dehydrogenase
MSPDTASLAEIEHRFRQLHAASRTTPAWDKATRLDLLSRLRKAIVASREQIADAIAADFGTRAREETLMAEILPCCTLIQHTMKHLGGWMGPERRPTAITFWPGRSRVHYQPKGVVLIVAPWNYPVQLALAPLATAIAAGNRVIVKPSELTPRTSEVLATLIEAALGPDVAAVATGGPDVAAGLSALPFDHILFTGSTAVGHKVMAAAAQHLTPVTLELGGKSPTIVDSPRDVATAAEKIARGKLLNSGQTCIAPDYALVQSKLIDTFASAYAAATAKLYPTVIANPQYSAIVNGRHYDRLMGLLADARGKGATVTPIDPARELPDGSAGSSNGRKIAPTLVTNVRDDMAIMQEEIFGPLLPVLPYGTLDEAIGYVNARPRPLALYYFGDEAQRADEVVARTTSGGVTINDTLLHFAQEAMPFGGIGPSGMGAYHGREGFLTFSHAKSTFVQSRFALTGLVSPPYGATFGRVMKAALRRAAGRDAA